MIKEWIIEWFAKNSGLTQTEIEKNLEANYIENAFIDSFAFITLVGECEEHFDVTFSDEDFENESIFTIEGLIKIIQQK